MSYKIEKIRNAKVIKPKVYDVINELSDENFAREVIKNLDVQYPHYDSTLLPLKNSVSAILAEFNGDKEFRRDEFLTDPIYQNTLLESTELGIAYHSAMQCYECNLDDESFIEKVKTQLSSEQLKAVSFDKIIKAKTKLDSLTSAPCKIYKEKKFMMSVPYNSVFTDSKNADRFLIQGVVDLLIEYPDSILLIDYKTNKTKNVEKLKSTYAMQLKLYKMSAELAFGKAVEARLYAFSIDDFC